MEQQAVDYAVALLERAIAAGEKAYREKLAEIEAGPDRFALYEADLMGAPTSGVVGTLKELCGFAWVVIPSGRTGINRNFIDALKKAGVATSDVNHRSPQIKITPHYPRGYCYWVSVPSQGVDSKEAFANALAETLRTEGIRCSVGTRLD